MKNSELRIGNWITFDGLEAQVTAIPEGDFYEDEKFKPIPITDEWLVKVGFESNNSSSNFLTYYNERYDYRIEIHQDGDVWFDELRKIQYVHQLQNLYFTLTGQELEMQ